MTALNQNLTIAYVLDTFPALSETFIRREIDACRERGVDITVCALHGEDADSAVQVLRPARGARLSEKSTGGARRALGYAIGFPGTLRQRLGVCRRWRIAAAWADSLRTLGIDHLHAHFAFAPADLAVMTGRLLGCSHSVSVHARDIYTQPDAILQYRLERAAFVAACTHHAKEALERRCPALRDRLHWIPHGVETRHPPAPWRDRLQPPLILAVARLVPKKGLSYLLEACGILAERGIEFQCVIVGEGPERIKLEQQVKTLSLGACVELTGARPFREMPAWYARATLCVAPSVVAADGDRDGLPNVLLEAQAAGRAVIGTTASAANELIREGDNGFLVPPADAAALAIRLEDALRDPDATRRMGEIGRTLVEKTFAPETGIRALLKQFDKCVHMT